MKRDLRPPRLARVLLSRVLPADTREAIEGDLFQLYTEHLARDGAALAYLWYWREALSFSVRFTADRAGRFKPLGFRAMPSALDFKLGARMLAKYPGLALVGGFGMAVATAVGAGAFAFFTSYLYPPLPLHEGDRVVVLANLDRLTMDANRPQLRDFMLWRSELRSVVDVGAFRTSRRNLITDTAQGEPVVVAEMTAAGFRVARVAPLIGRVLVDGDDRTEAPPVVVIGHDVWQTRFHGDRTIVGRTIRLGRSVHTVVGVMPEGFAFPISHNYWLPLRVDPAAFGAGNGPELHVFGRLAPGTTKEEAQAELTLLSQRAAAADPATHARLQPRVMPFTDLFADGSGDNWEATIMTAMVAMLLVLVCLNVAVLVYARTVTRSVEIAVRTALGATRVRIVTQLFTEAFVLSMLSALAGLGLVAFGLRFLDFVVVKVSETGTVPFWIKPGLSTGTIVYTLGLAILGAVIVGVLPGLKATGGQLQATLGHLRGGVSGHLGRTWTTLIVVQVACTVAILPPAVVKGGLLKAMATQSPGFAAEEVVVATVERESSAPAAGEPQSLDPWGATQAAVLSRLVAAPGVAGATYVSSLPGIDDDERIEIESGGVTRTEWTRSVTVGESYFAVFSIRVDAGRTFTTTDEMLPANRPVIVNRSFADSLFRGEAVVGQRIRHATDDDTVQPWRTIVGVVEDFPGGFEEPGRTNARIYHLAAPGEPQNRQLLVRLQGPTAAAFSPTLREIATAVDPTLQLRRIRPLDAAYADRRRTMGMVTLALALVVGSVLLLSAAGIYALMSFTVHQRRKEIGVRAALGGDARRILTTVLSRASWQLLSGVVIGLGLSLVIDRVTAGEMMGGQGLVLVPGISLFMATIGLLAAVGPARRGLRVHPTEALRME